MADLKSKTVLRGIWAGSAAAVYDRQQKSMKLYTDKEIALIREKHLHPEHTKSAKGQTKDGEDGLLNVVPNGTTRSIPAIFELLGLDLKRLGPPTIGALGHAGFYCWRVSPEFELTVWGPKVEKINRDTFASRTNGYGVRLQYRGKKVLDTIDELAKSDE